MYCPKCGSENRDDNSKFCRICGADISLVPKAMSGNLPEAESRRRGRHARKREKGGHANLSEGITNLFTGVGFLFVAFALARFVVWAGSWWFWMLIPAFGLIGKGIAEIVAAKQEMANREIEAQSRASTDQIISQDTRPVMPPQSDRPQMRAPNTGDLEPPPSVTENTTRQLDPPARENQ